MQSNMTQKENILYIRTLLSDGPPEIQAQVGVIIVVAVSDSEDDDDDDEGQEEIIKVVKVNIARVICQSEERNTQL